ncbi:carbon-nitrogen hydrolase family protein, partial [bacterium]|nr:carbon-nitrogen hydrolase family protein [bacterium]
MRAAVIQMNSGAEVAANLDAAGQLLAQAADAGAQLAVLPENFCIMPARRAQRLAAAEPAGDGLVQRWLAATAKRHGLWLVGGTMPMIDPRDTQRVRAASLLVAPDGTVAARYDKLHLFDVDAGDGEQYRESDSFSPGEHAVLASAGAAKLGLSVCYDVRFPELYRALDEAGAT